MKDHLVPNGYVLMTIEEKNEFEKTKRTLAKFFSNPPKGFKIIQTTDLSGGWYVVVDEEVDAMTEVLKDFQTVIDFMRTDKTLHPTTIEKITAKVKKYLKVD